MDEPEPQHERRRRRTATHPHERLRREAMARYGVSSRSEADRIGVAASTFEDWCRLGEVARVHRGVVVLTDAADVPERRIAAALLAAGTGAVAAGTTALFLHELLADAPERVGVLVPHHRRAPNLDGVRVRRTRHLDPIDVTEARGLPCTTVERTLLDHVREVGWGRDGTAVLLTALQRRCTDVASLRAVVERAGASRGGGLSRLLSEFDDGRTPDSIFEHLVAEALRAAGLPPVLGLVVRIAGRIYRIDLAFPDVRVVVECDGFAFHRTPDDLARDHARQNALVADGWRVLRISWQRWVRDQRAVVAEIREVLGA